VGSAELNCWVLVFTEFTTFGVTAATGAVVGTTGIIEEAVVISLSSAAKLLKPLRM
jgi:hypothetical protein